MSKVAVALGLTAAAIFGGLFWAAFVSDGRKDLDLSPWASPGDPWTRSMMPGAHWATDALCDEAMPCLQAVTSETVTLYRFAERDQAVAAAESFGDDGYLTGWIAIRYEPGGLTATERYGFEGSIGCINTWVSEDGRDC